MYVCNLCLSAVCIFQFTGTKYVCMYGNIYGIYLLTTYSDIMSLGNGGKMYQSIMKKLSMLQPLVLELEDESNRHAGHAGS
jgi:hypothetical protein